MMPQTVRFITVGNLKESYLREAAAEYKKRLSGMCRVEEIELKEVKLPDVDGPYVSTNRQCAQLLPSYH